MYGGSPSIISMTIMPKDQICNKDTSFGCSEQCTLEQTYINFVAVLFACDHFRCHPVGSAHHSLSLLVRLYLGAKTEIGNLDAAIHSQQYVVTFDVSMYDALKAKSIRFNILKH